VKVAIDLETRWWRTRDPKLLEVTKLIKELFELRNLAIG
jgi:hypothetical protein